MTYCEYWRCEIRVRAIFYYIVRRVIVRSTISWYENVKRIRIALLIHRTRIVAKQLFANFFFSTGSKTVNPQTIMNEIRAYYQNLNSNQDSIWSEELCSDCIIDDYIEMLSENSRKKRDEGNLSCTKCFNASLYLQNGQAPGKDLLTVDFFKRFWNLFCRQLTDCWNFLTQWFI